MSILKKVLKSPALCPIKECYNYRDYSGHHCGKTRGAGGSDGWWNRIGICRSCHIECHSVGEKEFIKKHSEIKIFFAKAKEMERVLYLYKNNKLKIENMTIIEKQMLNKILKELKNEKV